MPKKRNYAAFISYSHADEKFAAKLHQKLESWRTPRRLTDTKGRDGPVPSRLFPVFRDREELPTSDDLGATLRAALERSRYLIVLCSPNSAASIWVDEEVLQFKQMHGEGRIIAAVIAGDPPECFPPSLRYRIDEAGQLTTTLTEPIAADFREGKDEWSNGLMKVLAGLLGVNLDDLVMRDRKRRRERALFAAVLASVALAGTAYAVTERLEAERVRTAHDAVTAGLSSLRAGDTFRGSHNFLDGVRRLGDAAPAATKAYAEQLTKRLVPFDEAFDALQTGEIVTWRAQTYIRHEGRLKPFSNSETQARTATHIITSDVSGGMTARFLSDLSVAWQIEMDPREEICGIWGDGRADSVFVEGAYYGSYVGANYGFGGWFNLQTGNFVPQQGQLETTFCRTDDAPPKEMKNLKRLDSDVTAFNWPALRAESDFWELAALDPRMPLLYRDEMGAFVADMWINYPPSMRQRYSEDTLIMQTVEARSSNRVYRARICPGGGLAAGIWDFGANTGTMFACQLDKQSEATCAFLPMVGDILSIRFSPDCRMTAIAAPLIGDGGLAVVKNTTEADELPLLAVDGIDTLRQVRLPTFSPDGSLFAVTNDANRVLVFESQPSGLRNIAVHEVPANVVLLTFLGKDQIATVAADGQLRAFDARTGAPIWPAIPIGETISNAIDPALTYGKRERGRLVADQSGTRIALMALVPKEDASERRGSDVESNRATSLVQFFDGRLGVPLGAPLSTGWATGPEFIEDAWDLATLYNPSDGEAPRSLMFPPWAAYREVSEQMNDVEENLERLTAHSSAGALRSLPTPKP